MKNGKNILWIISFMAVVAFNACDLNSDCEHRWEWTITTTATETRTGERIEACTRCGVTRGNPQIIPIPDGATFHVSSRVEWDDAINAINDSGNNRQYVINITNDFFLPGLTYGFNFNPTDLMIIIQGNRTISLFSSGSLLRINAMQNIILQDIGLRGMGNNDHPLVRIIGGNLTMQGNASISGNTNNVPPWFGGGDFFDGGGVRIEGGSFTMNNGIISGNSACCGGGVHLSRGLFTMNSGIISGNSSVTDSAIHGIGTGGGGGVSIDSGTFTMNGGIISGNTALSAFGGGVLGWRTSDSIFIKRGGIIYGSDALLAGQANRAYLNGHAVAIDRNIRMRNTTALQNQIMDSRQSGAAGGWE